jgi:hypothetical protein
MERSQRICAWFLLGVLILILNSPSLWARTDDSESTNPAAENPTAAHDGRHDFARQSLSDAWWTGPMLAPSAGTLPRGDILIEPYFYDISASHSNTFGSLSYFLYGLANRFTVGAIPTVDYTMANNEPNSSSVERGDTSLLAQYGLTQFHPGRWRPATAINVQETFPTGRYDELENEPNDGFGSGAYTTALAFYSQTYFWMPNGRILRLRFNVSDAFSTNVSVQGVSVYGTTAGFTGSAKPGNTSYADAAWEYSATRSWVLALDIEYHFEGATHVSGYNLLNRDSAQDSNLGSAGELIFAPAIEYNWKPNRGVLLGIRIIETGHNIAPSITPALAVNFVH